MDPQTANPLQRVDSAESQDAEAADRMEHANRLFFRLYQCSNMMHKTGTRAVEPEGLTSQQWAVLGALSRPAAADGLSVGDLARYLMVTRQNLSGILKRMEREGQLTSTPDGRDRRSRLVRLTAAGRRAWARQAVPLIHAFYEQAVRGFSPDEMARASGYLERLVGNMQGIDAATRARRPARGPATGAGGARPTPRGSRR